MSPQRKVCVVTGARADFGPLIPLMTDLQADNDVQLQIIATGMHFSPEFGHTYREIEKHFIIDKKIEILLSSDSSIGVSKAMGLAHISFSEAYQDLAPDIVVVLGDRFEIFSATAVAMIMGIPIAHLSGGEITEGAIDDAIRHSITKMSHLHFVATESYRKRVMQLGENPDYIYNYGEASLDNITRMDLLSRNDFEQSLDVELQKKNLLVTFHPVTLESVDQNAVSFRALLMALSELENTLLIFTRANADQGGRNINLMIDEYVAENSEKAVVFSSLGQVRYLSALQYVDAVVGNTSSGIIEAPSFAVGTINIGSRQRGRIRAESVIDCVGEKEDILRAIQTLYTEKYKLIFGGLKNPYRREGSSRKTAQVLKTIDLSRLINKTFRDLA